MPAYALVHFPSIDTTGVDALRDEYDPYRDLIGVHITIIFPVTVERQALQKHIAEILAGWRPFTIRHQANITTIIGAVEKLHGIDLHIIRMMVMVRPIMIRVAKS